MIAVIAAVLAATPVHHWRTYTNERFAFSMCYPAELLRQRSSTFDGASFRAADGAELLVFGKYDIDGLSAGGEIMQNLLERRSAGATVIHHVAGHGWAIISGVERNKVFYDKAIDSGDRILQFVIMYPTSRNAYYRPIVERLTDCLSAGTPAF